MPHVLFLSLPSCSVVLTKPRRSTTQACMSAAIVSTRASIALSCESSDPWRFQNASTIPTAVAECDSRSSRAGDGVEDAMNGDVVGAAFCGTHAIFEK